MFLFQLVVAPGALRAESRPLPGYRRPGVAGGLLKTAERLSPKGSRRREAPNVTGTPVHCGRGLVWMDTSSGFLPSWTEASRGRLACGLDNGTQAWKNGRARCTRSDA